MLKSVIRHRKKRKNKEIKQGPLYDPEMNKIKGIMLLFGSPDSFSSAMMQEFILELRKDFFIRRMIFFCSVPLFCINISRVFSIKATSATEVDTVELLYFFSEEYDHCQHKEAKLKRYILGALTAGFVISVLELACTGQVYLPTIIFVSRMNDMKSRSLMYLLLYNTRTFFSSACNFIRDYDNSMYYVICEIYGDE